MTDNKPQRRTRWDVVEAARGASWSAVGRMCVMTACLAVCTSSPILAIAHLVATLTGP